MDMNGANFYNAVKMIKKRLKANAMPLQLPIGEAETFKGVVDLLEYKAVYIKTMRVILRLRKSPTG